MKVEENYLSGEHDMRCQVGLRVSLCYDWIFIYMWTQKIVILMDIFVMRVSYFMGIYTTIPYLTSM